MTIANITIFFFCWIVIIRLKDLIVSINVFLGRVKAITLCGVSNLGRICCALNVIPELSIEPSYTDDERGEGLRSPTSRVSEAAFLQLNACSTIQILTLMPNVKLRAGPLCRNRGTGLELDERGQTTANTEFRRASIGHFGWGKIAWGMGKRASGCLGWAMGSHRRLQRAGCGTGLRMSTRLNSAQQIGAMSL